MTTLALFVVGLITWLMRPMKTYTAYVTLTNGDETAFTIDARSRTTARLIAQPKANRYSTRHHSQVESLVIVPGYGKPGSLL